MRTWLRQLRKELRWTQADVAKRIGICQSYYGYIETEERQQKIDLPLLIRIAEVFHVPLDQLIELEKRADAARTGRDRDDQRGSGAGPLPVSRER